MEVNTEETKYIVSKEDFISKMSLNKYDTKKNVNKDQQPLKKAFLKRYNTDYKTSPLIKHTIIDMDMPSLSLDNTIVESEK